MTESSSSGEPRSGSPAIWVLLTALVGFVALGGQKAGPDRTDAARSKDDVGPTAAAISLATLSANSLKPLHQHLFMELTGA